MKKLLTLMIMLGLFVLPSITTEAALAAPSSWDYKFGYDGVQFAFNDGTNSYIPEFTRTADGIYFNYTWIGNANGLLPFEITLTFNRSNTSWTFGTTGYIASDTKIGSDNTVGSVIKIILNINNTSDNDYNLYIDFLSSPATTTEYSYRINNILQRSWPSGTASFPTFYNIYTNFSKTVSNFSFNANSNNRYLDSLYFEDLGTNLAIQSTTAYDSGFTDGFNTGYTTAVQEDNAYALGYALGLSEGQDMETGSSILIFVVAAIGFIMMIFGFTTKRGIFNLLSVGAFVVLGAMLAQYIGFIIIAIGLVIVNVYYAFWGDL